MAEETELKLRLADADLPRLSKAVSRLASGPSRQQRLVSLYFDTPSLDLLAAGHALRLRRVGRRWLQTLKGGGGVTAGLHRRQEQEAPAPGPQPVLERLPRRLRQQLRAAELTPVFRTDFRRRIWRVEGAGSRTEVALDEGHIEARRRSEPLLELELELLAGEPVALYDLALELAQHATLLPEPRSKAERGYALFRREAHQPSRARLPELDPDTRAEEAFVALLAAALEAIQRNQMGVLESDDPEFLHQMRVGLRRLRALLRLFSPVIPAANWQEELRWLAGELGKARDWDVLEDTLLPAFLAEDKARPAWLTRRIHRERLAARRMARAAVASARHGHLMLELGRWLATRGWRGELPVEQRATLDQPVRDWATARLARLHRKLLAAGRRLSRLDASQRHRLRIRAKRLRYGVESFASLYPTKGVRPFLKALACLQDLLGELNDLATASHRIEALAAAARHNHARREARRFAAWAARREKKLLGDLPKTWKRFRRQSQPWTP